MVQSLLKGAPVGQAGQRVVAGQVFKFQAILVQRGELLPEQITEESFSREWYTADMPDPDLIIRTANERRLSNFLLWQGSYAELWVTPVCWPDFGREQFLEALTDYTCRVRRYGGVVDAGS